MCVQARALWLVGVCSAELQPDEWGGAFRLAAAHMGAQDLVVSVGTHAARARAGSDGCSEHIGAHSLYLPGYTCGTYNSVDHTFTRPCHASCCMTAGNPRGPMLLNA